MISGEQVKSAAVHAPSEFEAGGSEIVVTSVRGARPRTLADSLVPIDAIAGPALQATGRVGLKDILGNIIPSLTTPALGGGGTSSSAKPVSIRGLSGDYVLGQSNLSKSLASKGFPRTDCSAHLKPVIYLPISGLVNERQPELDPPRKETYRTVQQASRFNWSLNLVEAVHDDAMFYPRIVQSPLDPVDFGKFRWGRLSSPYVSRSIAEKLRVQRGQKAESR